MSSYENFSKVYDLFMWDIPYDKWIENIEKIWKQNNLNPKMVAELGCGTGNITTRLSKKGYDMIGIDLSEQMLIKASDKSFKEKNNILYLNQDMREFELYGTVDSIICICDSINYILKENELLNIFKLVNNYLEPNGLFIFDVNTIYKFENILAENNFCETNENCAYIWENFYNNEKMINEFYMNFFIRDENSNLYERFEECHYERAYSINTLKNLIKKSGLELIGVYDEITMEFPTEESERIYFVSKEMLKNRENL